MPVNNEYIRLNRYKRSEYHWIVEDPVKSTPIEKPFALDLSLNPALGESSNYKSISDSITMIILSSYGEHIFRPWLGSSLQTMTFENFGEWSGDLASEIEKIETRVKVVNSSVLADPDNHTLRIDITYMVLDTGDIGEYSQHLAM